MKNVLFAALCLLCSATALQAQQQGLDPTFGNGGIVLKLEQNAQLSTGGFGGIVLLPDGRFVVAGDSLRRYHTDGSLDYTFGSNGAAIYYYGFKMLLQPDGKILTAGGRVFNAMRGGVFRCLPDGGADSSFGVNGKVTIDDSTDVDGLLLQPDGKVILMGRGNQKRYIMVCRYGPDGMPDSSFGGTGRVAWRYEYPLTDAFVRGGGLMADGRIIIGGDFSPAFGVDSFFAMRFMPDGVLDTSFNHRGIATIPYIRPCTDVAVQPDGKVLLAGYQNLGAPGGIPPFLLARLNADGSIDSGFAEGGLAVYQWPTGNENKTRVMLLQPDGRILLAGRAGNGNTSTGGPKYDFALVRYLPDGSLDTGFGSNGALQTRIRNNTDDIYDIALQADGRIIAVGVTEWENCSNCTDGAMVRYLPDGKTDIEGTLPAAGGLRLYPNPAAGRLYITYDPAMAVTSLQLYDATGRLLQEWKGKVTAINLQDKAKGIYILRIGTKDGNVVSRKVVVGE